MCQWYRDYSSWIVAVPETPFNVAVMTTSAPAAVDGALTWPAFVPPLRMVTALELAVQVTEDVIVTVCPE